VLDNINESNKDNKKIFFDWRVEFARILAMIYIVIIHLIRNANYIEINILSPLYWVLFVAMATFFYISGHVQGLKDDFGEQISLNKSAYLKYVKSRFLRLYPGYYVALLSIFLARFLAFLIVNKPFMITGWGLFLDLTSLTSVLGVFGKEGAIWPIGWFIFALFFVNLLYPVIRRIISMKKMYIYLLIIGIIAFRLSFLFYLPYAAYYFPTSWLAEFTIGVMIGRWSASTGGPPKPRKRYQKIIIKAGSRVWPMYLTHMMAIAFVTLGASATLLELVIIFISIIIISEIYYRLLKKTDKLIDRVFF
jgi:peptidoglycan/LPS O-acetylase OafA/YrhL